MKIDISQQLSKRYAPAVVNRLSAFPSRDQLPIAAWLIKIPVGTNYALQILECLKDLSTQQEVAAAQILTQVLAQFPSNPKLPKELGRQVRDLLYGQLHPQSSNHQSRFQDWVKSLGLPKAVTVKPPQNFEGETFQLQVDFQTSTELQEKLQQVLASSQDDAWDKLKEF